jgi:hypothetical protein
LKESNKLRREAREALEKENEDADRQLEIAKRRETEEREIATTHEIEERVAGRQRSKDRFEFNAALKEGPAALEDEDDANSKLSHGMSTGDVNRWDTDCPTFRH